jgi:Protein of unknown function (DUF402)
VFEPGQTVVLQEVWRERVWGARPMQVVRDEGDFVALWFPRGTRWMAPIDDPSRDWDGDRGERLAECAATGRWAHRKLAWEVDTLQLLRRGDWHAVWVCWLPDGENYGWYVNLQRPFRRSPIGFETMDLALDLVVEPDRSWRWKDEDELEAFVERGVFEPELPQRLRGEALRVLERLELSAPPFAEPWHEWRPDAGWELPRLPEGWERVWR